MGFGRVVISAVLATSMTGCLGTQQAFTCEADASCGASGQCEDTGFCSFVDPGCATGHRYGDLAGTLSNTCVGDIVGPPDDVDNDTVLNDNDNCPDKPNTDQANEDGDKFGDACDPCPIVADDDPSDLDADGVGDECDPNPDAKGDRIVFFEGFASGKPSGWTDIGNWTYADGKATVVSSLNEENLFTNGATLGTRDLIIASLTVDTLVGTGARTAGVTDMHTIGGDGLACAPGRNASDAPAIYLVDTGSGTTVNQSAATVVDGTAYRLRMSRAGSDYDCRDEIGAVETSTTYAPMPASPRFGLRTKSVGATFDYILVVTGE